MRALKAHSLTQAIYTQCHSTWGTLNKGLRILHSRETTVTCTRSLKDLLNTLKWLNKQVFNQVMTRLLSQMKTEHDAQRTFRNFSILTEAPTKGESDVGQVHGRIREALGATISSCTSHWLWGLGARECVRLGPLPGAGVRFTVGREQGEKDLLYYNFLFSPFTTLFSDGSNQVTYPL